MTEARIVDNNLAPSARRIACIDFDGTIKPWGPLFSDDPPIKGAKEALQRIKDAGYTVVIFTSRMSGRWLKVAKEDQFKHADHVAAYLDKYSIPWDEITAEKIPAEFYVDDRAYRFTGTNWKSITNRVLR